MAPETEIKYVTHPLIKPDSLESRIYQLSIAMHAADGNTLVVLPTGLGKTAVALLCTAMRLKSNGGKILMLAPTKPLVDQHLKYFSSHLIEPEDDGSGSGSVLFTGENGPKLRKKQWDENRLIFATPEVIKNDLIAGRYDLKNVSLLIVDECHRTVGNYAYVFIAQEYMKTAENPLILAMTASPGSKNEKLMEVCSNLYVKIVETRTEEDSDVKPYIHERDIKYVNIEFPPELEHAVMILKRLIANRLDTLKDAGYVVPTVEKLSMASLNMISAQVQKKIAEHDSGAFTAASIHAEIMKIRHAVTLAESQGSEILKTYLNRLSAEGMSPSGTKASQRLAHDELFTSLLEETEGWTGELLPKFEAAYKLVSAQLEEYPDSRVIIFANYRDTVMALCDYLEKKGIDCRRFIGQASTDAGKGLSQKKQIQTLSEFKAGEFRVLAATSVGEEGLDVPSTDMVIFYESVPSEIRSIQRKGRTGRHGTGTIYVLAVKGTTDETFTFVSRNREKSMKKATMELSRLASSGKTSFGTPAVPPVMSGQTGLSDNFGAGTQTASASGAPLYVSGQRPITSFESEEVPMIIADDRESHSKVVEYLHSMNDLPVALERLEFGDYAIGDRILVERKTTRDFMDTLVERDLIGQVRSMAEACIKPVLIIEGEDLYNQRNINPNAVRGALAALSIGYGVSIFYTADAAETADMLAVIARREADRSGGRMKVPHYHKTYMSKNESLEYIVSAFPSVGLKAARILLDSFGSIENIVRASYQDLIAVDGIGEKTAKAVYDTVREMYHKY